MTEQKNYKTVLVLLSFCIALLFVYAVRNVLMPFIVSAVFAYVLSPLISKLQVFGLKRYISVTLLFAVFLVFFSGSLALFLPKVFDEITVLKQEFPVHLKKTETHFLEIQKKVEKKYPFIKKKKVFQGLNEKTQGYIEKTLTKTPSFISSLFSLFSILFLIPILTFFMLLSGREVVDSVFDLFPSKHVETALGIISEIDETLGKYVVGQLVESAIVGGLSIIGLLVLKVDYAIILGIIVGVSNMVPYVGPVFSTIPALVIAFLKFQSATIIFSVILMFLIVQFIDNNVLKPLIVSQGVNIGPVMMVFALMAGAEIYGMVGMLLAVPAASIVKTTVQILLGKHPTYNKF